MKRIPLLVPDMPVQGELAPYLARIDAERWYTNFGPLATELEERSARFFAPAGTGAPQIVAMANATLALELALIALSLAAGSRVLLPALTFVASAASIVRAGHVPVLCDVDASSWLLTPEIAERVAGEARAAAVMPVATYGCPQDPAQWDRFTQRTGIPVVIDAAAAFANQSRLGKSAAIFSLHATKSLGAGEGALVVSSDRRLLEELRRLSNFGIHLPEGLVHRAGTNAKLSEYHAAVALASLDGWVQRSARRIEVHRRYLDRLAASCPNVRLQERAADGVYSIMPVLLPEGIAASPVAAGFAGQGIETRRWYCPTLEQHPAFSAMPVAGGLAVSRILSERLLALPFHTRMDDADVARVCDALANLLLTLSRAAR